MFFLCVCFFLRRLLLLYVRQVSPDAVAISYTLFWEQGEYWRVFTASFSHFELLHMLFNAMGVWNTRALETLLGSFKYLYLVSAARMAIIPRQANLLLYKNKIKRGMVSWLHALSISEVPGSSKARKPISSSLCD